MATGMKSRLLATVFCVAVVYVITPVSSKWVEGSIDTIDDWKFITRFCFLSQKGRFDYVFKYPVNYGVQQLLLYYDKPGQWESVYKSNKNCSTRRSVLSKVNNQIIDLTNRITDSRSAGCSLYQQDGEDHYNCTDYVTFHAARERWWYIVVARCGRSEKGKMGLKLDYKIHMMNGPADDYWHHELSADEFYILPVDIAFLVVFLALLVVSIICAVKLYNRQMLHTTYRMYMTALSLWIFGLFLECIAWGRHGEHGWEEKPTEVAGRLFRAASTAVFLLMLLLLAKGYTITRGRLTQMSTVRLTIFFCLYVIVNITLFIWEGQFFDEGLVLYFYESPPGYGLIAMRLVGWLWFVYAFIFTMKHHPNKAKFYVPFFIFYTIWFWTGPIVILVAIYAIAKWSREKTVNGVEQFVALCGYLFFLVLTLPCAANKNFPYHLRVSQVRFSDNEEEPTETYGMSEESRRYLDSIFTVTDSSHADGHPASSSSSTASSSRSSPPSYTSENGGHVNGGYSKREKDIVNNGNHVHEPPADTYLPTMGNPPPSYEVASRLPPIGNHGPELSSPSESVAPSAPPVGHRASELPPLPDSAQALPPIAGAQRLPPLNAGRPPPAIFSSAQPTAPAAD